MIDVCAEPVPPAQLGAQGQHDVENHPHPGQILTGKGAARLIRIDDNFSCRQRSPGQVMIGDQGPDAGGSSGGNTLNAGDTIVDGDNEIGLVLRGQRDNFRRQSVAVLKAVGYQVTDIVCPHGAQRADYQCGAGGPIGIEIANYCDLLLRCQRVGQQFCRRLGVQ